MTVWASHSHLLPWAKFERQNGFTLLEVLIAIVITAMLGTGSFYLLSQGIRTKELTESRAAILEELQKSQRIMEYDFTQAVGRSIRGEYGDNFYAFTNLNALTLVEFTRTGWRDAKAMLAMMDENAEILPRSQLQRISYEMEEDDLYRLHWDVLDRAQDSRPVRQKLLSGVSDFKIRFLYSNDEWVEQWPPLAQLASSKSDPYRSLPKAVELTFTHETFGDIRRFFEVAGSMIPAATVAGSSGSNGQGSDNGDNLVNGSDSGNTGIEGGVFSRVENDDSTKSKGS